MTTSVPRPPRVRLRFVVALMLVLPFLAHAIWDYVEARRLNARIDSIILSGAPTSTDRYQPLTGGAADADRYYRAAAALAGGFRLPASPQMAYRVNAAMRDGNWTPDLVDELRARVDEHREALSLVDRAAALPFEGFSAGWSYNYLGAGIIGLSRLCELRATERALAGDSDAAFDSLYSGVQLVRAMGRAPQQLAALRVIVARTKPSPAAQARLADALAVLDRDDRMAQDFLRLRAVLLDEHRRGLNLMPWIARPWMAHLLTRRLDVFAALIAAAQKPPAERHAAVMAVGDWPMPFPVPADLSRLQLNLQVSSSERQVAAIRCARRLVAGEVVDCQP